MHKTESQVMYDNLAVGYRTYSNARIAYLRSVDFIVKKYISSNINLIDFGAADGVRISNIVSGELVTLCMVENSCNMIHQIKHLWPDVSVATQDFSDKNFCVPGHYDIATCLWNVLGHLGDKQSVLTGLQNIKNAIKEDGICILDVNNRHNIAQYGAKAIKNIIRDTFRYKFENGDIKFKISLKNNSVPSSVHLFTRREIEQLIKQSGFVIKRKFYINYANGKHVDSSLLGQLCYVLTIKK